MTVEDVASRLLCSAAKISRIETGGRSVSLRDVRDLCAIYEVSAAGREHLMELARESKQRAWWQAYDLPYKTFIGLETAAVKISDFESGAIPGLLQTREYARALAEGTMPKLTADVVQQTVDARLMRQQLLTRDNPPRFWTVIDEAALRRVVGSSATMREQLSVLAERALLPTVTVQIIPFESGAHPGIDSTFTILEFDEPTASDVVYVEGLVGNIYLERRVDIERYKRVFDEIRAIALGPRDSIALIERIGTAH
jgi:transcriptional regulator with XRE-family HTH domain